MSQPDTFIDEVTEAVRRDKLYAAFRRYGWIGLVVILVIVGGTGWREYARSREAARAEAFGDAILDAVDLGAPQDRQAAFAAMPASDGQLAVQDLLLAAAPEQDKAAVLAALDRLAADASQPQIYRDLAVLRRVLVAAADQPLADRRAALQALAEPGRALRVLAEEQLAYLQIEEGLTAEAIAALGALYQDQEATPALQNRLAQVIIALGGVLPQDAAAETAAEGG